MAKLKALDPVVCLRIPGAGRWELRATEAARTTQGIAATVQLWNGSLKYIEAVKLANPAAHQAFLLGDVVQRCGIPRAALRAALMRLTAAVEQQVRKQLESLGSASGGGGQSGSTQATGLVDMALGAGAELFHDPAGDAYATIQVEQHRETWPLRVRGFRRWLARKFYEAEDKASGAQALQDALGVLEGKAIFDGPEHAVFTRLAEHGGTIYLDLGNERWEAVAITPNGWQVVADPPVKFLRARGMLPLPTPAAGGNLTDLRPFLNLGGESDWCLVVSWLVAALRPTGPFPVLVLNGEQGSAKSTLVRVLRAKPRHNYLYTSAEIN